jgi:two-component system response regulator (stage 0 sporulation protein A)
MGVSPSLLGYKYITEAIMMVLLDESKLYAMVKCIYTDIAKKFDTKPTRVERAIRHAVERSACSMSPELKSAVFGNLLYYNNGGKPTNSEFIATCVQLITTEINNEIWKD